MVSLCLPFNLDVQTRNSGMLRRLESIQFLLGGFNDENDRCLNNFRKWSDCRQKTLTALQKFQDEFDKIHMYSSAGRAVGNGATVLGSLATIIGFGMSFSKDLKGVGNELMKYGSTVGTVGGATSVASSLAEKGFSAAVLKEVKATLEKDQQLTEALLDRFERTKKLDSLLKDVFGCSVLDISDIFPAIEGIRAIYSKGGKVWKNIQEYSLSLVEDNFSVCHLANLDNTALEKIFYNANYKFKLLLAEFCNNPAVRKATWAIYDCFKKNPISFDLSKISILIVKKIAGQEIALFNRISLTGGQSMMSYVDLTTRGIFQTINVALSVLAFISAVDDIRNGRSKYSELIKDVKKHLLLEMIAFEEKNGILDDDCNIMCRR